MTPKPCPLCRGFGFVACPEAHEARGIRIVVAWEHALPCGCSAGEQFRENQAEWKKEAEPPITAKV